jgi:hypothetical protein
MNIYRPLPDTATATPQHPYSRTCNCETCWQIFLTLPEPSEEEKQRMAREFMAAVAPSSGGELVTDWPKVSFPDLDALAKGQRKFERDFGCEPARILK